ncbi:MAG: efflux RND transporter periplasmic adaptor subunit [Candidatus Methylomirabilis oxygeniifera]|uniref:Biotin/lipoyl attachment:Secretion protein HlyD n=1 Tax=Methylomirabilis oxygeniifera TaxID=671143 RepID=D5MGT9_METO1|nr:MAG: efflux RND transporter periplasmic adaptor subunit [Candidatus Methylomirabilis oxyfera]CBE68970.1 Biotin/lipoyl attachment:Secretion protein HlyD precursor [Candidatus Methylomirabilis oxyfera]
MTFLTRHRKRLIIATLVLGLLVVGLRLTLLAPYRIESAGLEPHDLQREAFGVGTVEAKVVVSIGSKITGRVTALNVDQPDRVRKGQLLATLENQDFHEQVAQAEHDLARTAADLVANDAAIRQAEANRALARKNYERYQSLSQEGAVSRLDFEQKENEHIAAQEAVNTLLAQRTSLEKQQKKASANLNFAKAKLTDTMVHASCDGVVVTREVEVGDAVVAGAPIFRIADCHTIWVRAHVDETVAGAIAVGQPARVILRSRPEQSLPGQVVRVEVESDRVTEEKAVNVTFSVPSSIPPIGEQAEVYIITGQKTQVSALPQKALVPIGKSYGVWLIQGGRVHLRQVQVGISDPSGWIEIVGGLDSTDRVALAPPEIMLRLKDNARVAVSTAGS